MWRFKFGRTQTGSICYGANRARALRQVVRPDEFRRYIEDEVMKKKLHPDAKPTGAFSLGPRTE
jgi:hypothetical protein